MDTDINDELLNRLGIAEMDTEPAQSSVVECPPPGGAMPDAEADEIVEEPLHREPESAQPEDVEMGGATALVESLQTGRGIKRGADESQELVERKQKVAKTAEEPGRQPAHPFFASSNASKTRRAQSSLLKNARRMPRSPRPRLSPSHPSQLLA